MENAQEPAKPERYADSIEAAAGMTGRSESFLAKVKGLGCPAFRGSRVYVDELEDYIEENDLEDLERKSAEADQIDIEIRKERLRKLQIANDLEAGRYIKKEEVADVVLKLGLELKAKLRKKFEEDLPHKLIDRKTREEVLAVTRPAVDEICRYFYEGAPK